MKNIKLVAFLVLIALAGLSIFSRHQFTDPPAEAEGQTGPAALNVAASTEPTFQEKQKVLAEYGKLPMHFEPNRGQTDERVKYLARGHGYSLFLSENESIISLRKSGKEGKPENTAVVRLQLKGAAEGTDINGQERIAGTSNYLIGRNSDQWRTDIPNYRKVRYSSVYDGIDLVYYGTGQQLEYDFVVRPGFDPNQIKLSFDGVDDAIIDKESGDLLLETGAGELRQLKPVVYQETDVGREQIAAQYALRQDSQNGFELSFEIAKYDTSKELIIDPILAYGSYLGGNAFDEGRSITVDADGHAYIAGTAASLDYPTTPGTIKPELLPRTDAPNSYWYDAFVSKMSPDGTSLVFSTYYGGRNGNETGSGVVLDAGGNVVISGTTMSGDLPTVNAYQSTFGGTDDAFVAKLNPTGSSIIFSTYLGGNNTDTGGRVAINRPSGDIVTAGYSSSPNFPTTPGAYKERLCNSPQACSGIFYSGAYVVKLSASGSAVYSTLFDAGIADIAIDAADNAVLAGSASSGFPTTPGAYQPVNSGGADGFIAKMNPAGTAMIYGTFLGGGLQSDRISSIALDSDQNMYVTGTTENTGFPTTPGAFDTTFNGGHDGFVTKLNAAGSALAYSTFLGGTGKDEAFAIGLGANNDVFVAGETLSNAGFPKRNSIMETGSIFVTRFNTDASALVFSTLLGIGGAYDIAVDAQSSVYVTGHTTLIVTTPDAFQTIKGNAEINSSKDAFVAKLSTADENATFYTISGTINDSATFSGNQSPLVATITGTVNRSITVAYSGNGMRPYSFGTLPAGGNYTITVKKAGFATEPESVSFPNLGANQFADFTILPNQRPEGIVVTPQHGEVFSAPATIPITATASDPDGHAIAKVDFVAYSSETGSIPLFTDAEAPYEYSWTNIPVGTWSINAIPTDELGLRGQSMNVVHVMVVDPTGANVSLISPTEGQHFVEGRQIPIAVQVSSSVNLVEVKDQNGNMVGRMIGSPWTTSWRAPDPGSYTLTATAYTAASQQADSVPVNIVVDPIDHRIFGIVRDTVTGNGIAGVNMTAVSSSNPAVTAQTTTDSEGNYIFTGLGTTPNDSIAITPALEGYSFNPQTMTIPYLGYIEWPNQNFDGTPQTQIDVALTSPVHGATFTSPATIELAATAASGAGMISKVEFFRRMPNGSATLLGTDTKAPFSHQLTGVTIGTYNYFVRATDSTNAAKDSAAVGISVHPPAVSLSGRIVGPDGNGVPGVTVYIGGGMAWTEDTDAEGNFIFANYPGGRDYYITPFAANGITYTPVSRSFLNVTENVTGINFTASTPNQAPTLQLVAPTDGAVYTMPAAIPIQVTASDPDNNIQRLRVLANNGSFLQTIVQTSNSTINTTWQPNQPGTYVLIANVRDHGGLEAWQEITITVNPPAPVRISGRIVDRNSTGIAGVTVELKDYPADENVIGTATTDSAGNYTIDNVTTFNNYILRASHLNYSFAPQQRVLLNLAASQSNADYTGTLQVPAADFDGDGESDVAVWRPSDGVWHVSRSGEQTYTAHAFGGASYGDVVVPGNYDGDKKIDYAVYRHGTWIIQSSSSGGLRTVNFGIAGDIPVSGDYDGDGKTDIAVWRESNGTWYVLKSSDSSYYGVTFGQAGDKPVSGDYDGDGRTDVTIWRPSTGMWYIIHSGDGTWRSVHFGVEGDLPLSGDINGDKKADIMIYRPSAGDWHTLVTGGNYYAAHWGIATDRPVPGDYDHDGKTDYAVFRESEGMWYMILSRNGSIAARHFGVAGDVPIPAAYIR